MTLWVNIETWPKNRRASAGQDSGLHPFAENPRLPHTLFVRFHLRADVLAIPFCLHRTAAISDDSRDMGVRSLGVEVDESAINSLMEDENGLRGSYISPSQ